MLAAIARAFVNRPGIDNRPGGVGGAGGDGNRPGIDNRPGGVGGVGVRRCSPASTTVPAGSTTGFGNSIGSVGGINNRPITGSGNTINRAIDNVGRESAGTNLAGIGLLTRATGSARPLTTTWRGAYWGYHQGWANGYWHGYHNNNNWGWGSICVGGRDRGVTAWALGSSFYNWGYASYANPYYAAGDGGAQPIVIEQTVVGG